MRVKSTAGQAQDEDRALQRAVFEFQDRPQVVGQLLADGQSDAVPAALGGAARDEQFRLEFRGHTGSFVVHLEVHHVLRRENQ